MAIRRNRVSETLLEMGVEAPVLQTVQRYAEKHEVPMRTAVLKTTGVAPAQMAAAMSRLSGLPVLNNVDVERVDIGIIRAFPLTLARGHGVLPLYVVDDELIVGLGDIGAMNVLDDLRVLYGFAIRPVLLPADVLERATNAAYDKASKSASAVLEEADDVVEEGDDLLLDGDAELLDDPNQAPIIRFVNAVISQAIKERASDIHIEPYEKDLVVRYRVDGILKETIRPSHKFKHSIVARIKIMSGLNIAEKRLPQDGRIRRKMGGREIDFRVSTVPVRQGERVVMRILEKGQTFSLAGIGMSPTVLKTFRGLIRRPHGILLVTGPTGSGKSTTLYSAITEINTPNKNILTIEDPVEYEVQGIGQVQVNHKINLTFGSALRAFLRQDPDVILVGEIRDTETANNAVQASLTGHLVFSTLHTNDAASAFARMGDMDVESFLVADTLLGVMAQRLVRTLCLECRQVYEPSDVELKELGISREKIAGHTVYRARGCEACNQRGYNGRTGIYEFLETSEEIRKLVIANAPSAQIKRSAVSNGMVTLFEMGVEEVLVGRTTFEEVKRVTSSGDE
ncbi:MAG: type II secretion system ATPase GspE [Rhodobacterales bacterium]|nr:type II secretion system ATPase GspE [Rhodobacterales bacterium]